MKISIALLVLAYTFQYIESLSQVNASKLAGLLAFCNDYLNGTVKPVIRCAKPYYCDAKYSQCLVPVGGKCQSTYFCAQQCYNSKCYTQDNLPGKCDSAPSSNQTCKAPFFCDPLASSCRIKQSGKCKFESCQSGYACNKAGRCAQPDLYDSCLADGPKCKKGFECSEYWEACLVPLGGMCKNDSVCGGEYTALCKKGKCSLPGPGDLCKTTESGVPVNNCARNTKCDSTSQRCKIIKYRSCSNHPFQCEPGTKCKYIQFKNLKKYKLCI